MVDKWSINKAKQYYNIDKWGEGYFDINSKGQVVATINANGQQPGVKAPPIVFSDLVEKIEQAGLTFPVLVRFSDILKDRVHCLQSAFANAITKNNYAGSYYYVYPIKVNQQRRVVEQIINAHPQVGLEAGSKSELMILMAYAKPGRLIVCNGYKDKEYIRLALIAQKLGMKVLIIIEKISEIEKINLVASEFDCWPLLGVRVRLSSLGKGNWQNTGGEKSKFGLSPIQILQLIEKLKQVNKLENLVCQHVHLGSQIANIEDLNQGLMETAQYFLQLDKLGVKIKYLDVGGGLGVDYEGAGSKSYCSMNYNIDEYANIVTATIKGICQAHNLAEPHIISESGRAVTAHHAVLISEVIDHETIEAELIADHATCALGGKSELKPLAELAELATGQFSGQMLYIFNQATATLNELNQLFNQGKVSLEQKAAAYRIYFYICTKIKNELSPQIPSHQNVLDELNQKTAAKLFCNFSLFQSLPDSWAIGQIFPILPLSGIDSYPGMQAVIQDITCDSDGRINSYVDNGGLEKTIALPMLDQTPYYLGFFLVGAYQEILGDIHNLFGDTDSVHVEVNAEGQVELVEPILGDSVDKVLKQVHFDANDFLHKYKKILQQSELSAETITKYLQILTAGLSGYTYLERED